MASLQEQRLDRYVQALLDGRDPGDEMDLDWDAPGHPMGCRCEACMTVWEITPEDEPVRLAEDEFVIDLEELRKASAPWPRPAA